MVWLQLHNITSRQSFFLISHLEKAFSRFCSGLFNVYIVVIASENKDNICYRVNLDLLPMLAPICHSWVTFTLISWAFDSITWFFCLCFFQVRSTIKTRFDRWQEHRSIATRYTRASVSMNPDQMCLTRTSFVKGVRGSAATSPNSSNGRLSNGSLAKDYLKNNNENGYGHSSTPMLRDEAV